MWDSGYLQRTSLYNLGLQVYLGHPTGICPLPEPLREPFAVVDMNGFHLINIQWCGCNQALRHLHCRQLLRSKWYPATTTRPRTAFTFDVLDTFHKLTLQGKFNLNDFYRGTLQKTDNCGRTKKIVSLLKC